MKVKNVLMIMLVLFFCLSVSRAVPAEDNVYMFSGSDSIRDVLKKNKGKRVYVMLEAGGELTGTVEMVGDRLVHISKVGGGMDYYDAVVSIDEITGVKYKARGFK